MAGQMKPARPTPPWMGDRCRDMPGTRGQWDVMCDPGPIAGRAPSGSPSSVAARADGRLVACDVSASCLPLPGRPWHPILVMSQAGGAVVAATIQIDSLEPMLHRVAAELHLLGNTQAYFRARAAGRMPSDALRQACRRLYQQHAAWIRHVVQSYGVPAHAVDDCVQDVWLAVIGSLDAFDLDPRRGTFRGWLRAVIHHKVADFARRRARQPATRIDELTLPLCSDEPGPAETYEARRRVRILRETVDELDQEVSTTSYQVFARRWIEGQGVSRVASALNLSRNDVRTRTHRAKRKLKQLLEAKEVGGDEDR
ncbi:MAG: sigma-70 family RNA polymerase sigma factor [Pirellulaceae bacterium]